MLPDTSAACTLYGSGEKTDFAVARRSCLRVRLTGVAAMIFRMDVPERIASGEVTLAFRRWIEPPSKNGSTLRTALGVVKIAGIWALAGAIACSAESPRRAAPFAPAASAVANAGSPYVRGLRASLPAAASLTLDPVLQSAAEQAVAAAGRPAAVVAFDAGAGTVRALFSVQGERGDPLTAAHVPASTFKVFAAIAGLEAGALTPDTVEVCDGKFPFHGKELRCSMAHGRETTADAIGLSCNVFFYSMATRMDHWQLLETARRYGFGARTGIELPESEGAVPDRVRYEAVKADPASTAPLLDAMGHGEVTVTLLQLSRAVAVIANGGKLVKLHVTRPGEVERVVPISLQDLALVRGALLQAVEGKSGTARAAAVPGLRIAGKTGASAAPALDGVEHDDRWFVAYAPADDPEIVVGARVERARENLGALFVVHEVLEAYRAHLQK